METALFVFIALILITISGIGYYAYFYMLFSFDQKGEKTKALDSDPIREIGIDKHSRLYIKPSSAKFQQVYREGMVVHWDEEGCFLYTPKPRHWTYFDWYKQMIKVAESQSTRLKINNETNWTNVPDELKQKLIKVYYS